MVINQDDESGRASKYNLDEQTTNLIADLQRQGIVLSNLSKFNKAMRRWCSIQTLIEARFTDDEKESLDKLREEYWGRILITFPSALSSKKDFYGNSELNGYMKDKANVKKSIRLRRYVQMVQQLMRKYKIGTTDLKTKKRLH